MICEFVWCIYNQNSLCLLEKIQIDALGMCSSCEMVTVPEELLNKHKIARLARSEKSWKIANLNHPRHCQAYFKEHSGCAARSFFCL